MEAYQKNYSEWLKSEVVDELTLDELNAISSNENEIRLRFSEPLSFGTAGLRGVMRAGINAMNVYTVAHATQALADVINEDGEKGGVVIAWDSRNNSRLFAETSCCVLCANGIKVYMFPDLRPTPELSFAIRRLGCSAGINITASHNPMQYNGYKAYGENGAQISPEVADKIAQRMAKIDIFSDVSTMSYDEALGSGYVTVLDETIDDEYIKVVLDERVDKSLIPSMADNLKVVYTPLHGTGATIVPTLLKKAGVKNLYTVDEQIVPDGDFPTVVKPNPEYKEAFELGIEYANRFGADLIIATDPDADRTGCTIRNAEGEFITITGNQIGALLLDYLLCAYEQNCTMPEEPYAVKSIVSTELATKICDSHGVKMYNVLTGFKFIGEVMEEHIASGHGSFILGFEESYGFLKGTYARDKDACVASMLICEMAAFHQSHGRTLADALNNLYEKYGYYKEGISEIYFEGVDGAEKMSAIMDVLRTNPPEKLGGEAIEKISDYLTSKITYLSSDSTRDIDLPKSNVIAFESENGNISIARPSGTEPKIKFYFLCHADSPEGAESIANACKEDFAELAQG